MFNFVETVNTAQAGRTHIFSVGQAGFIIRSSSEQLLGIDLYLSDCVERVEGHTGFKRLLPKILAPKGLAFDCVIATHSHRDHFDIDSMQDIMANDNTTLYASVDCINDIENLQLDYERVVIVKAGDEYTQGDFTLTFINCDHGKGMPYAVGVIVTVDSKTILFTGDTCLRLDWVEEYLRKGNLDMAVAPINGAYGNMNETDCVVLAEKLKPAIFIPCHFGMFASHGGNPEIFRSLMIEKDFPFVLMGQGEKYSL